MSNKPIPNDPTDDELESLAQDLFGVSLNEQQDLEPFDVGDFDLDEGEPDTTPESVAAPEAEGEEPLADDRAALAADSQAADDDFGSSVLDEESAELVASAGSGVALTSDHDATSAEDDLTESEEDEPEPEVSPSAADVDDDYWDALDGFNWDDESDVRQMKPELRKEYVETSETFEDLSIESAEKTDEFLDDAEFGAGLDEEAPARSSATPAVESDEEADRKEERKGRRRRGRRRGGRGRGESSEAEQRSKSVEPAADLTEKRNTKMQDVTEDEDELEAGSDEEGFGAGLEIGETEEEQSKKRRRRRGGRRRSRRKAGEDSSSDDRSSRETSPETSAERTPEADIDETETELKTSKEGKYRSVPTWEEAISYLVRGEPHRSGGGNKSGSGPRRGGRRGSSRRKSS